MLRQADALPAVVQRQLIKGDIGESAHALGPGRAQVLRRVRDVGDELPGGAVDFLPGGIETVGFGLGQPAGDLFPRGLGRGRRRRDNEKRQDRDHEERAFHEHLHEPGWRVLYPLPRSPGKGPRRDCFPPAARYNGEARGAGRGDGRGRSGWNSSASPSGPEGGESTSAADRSRSRSNERRSATSSGARSADARAGRRFCAFLLRPPSS